MDGFLFDRQHQPLAGWVSMLVAMVLSIWLFANQTLYIGLVAKATPASATSPSTSASSSPPSSTWRSTRRERREPQEAILVTPEGTTAAA